MINEALPDGHEWLRIADPSWADPLDPAFAQRTGGRWNPPGSFPTLYLNEDLRTARITLAALVERWPYEPEDLRKDTGPVLVRATLPRRQIVADIHTAPGVAAAGLPPTYPLDETGALVPHGICQPIGRKVHETGRRGVHCRSAHSAAGAGRELAWFPATSRSRAKDLATLSYEDWYWG